MAAERRANAREALLGAFAELALSRRYGDFGVDEIVRRARVARSTFYYHFRQKDELLLQNMRPMLLAAARLPLSPALTPEAEHWVAHLWEHRAVANRIVGRPVARQLVEALAQEIRFAMRSSALDAPAPGPCAMGMLGEGRVDLLAHQIAGSMTGLLQAWLTGKVKGDPAQVARMLWAGARALLAAQT